MTRRLVIFLIIAATTAYSNVHAGITLTEQEKVWIEKHPVFNLGISAGYAPFSFVGADGEYTGMVMDYIAIFKETTGIDFRITAVNKWSELMTLVQEKKIDGVACAGKTEDREKYMIFADPYIVMPWVIVTRNDSEGLALQFSDLAGKKVAVLKASPPEERMKRYPGIKIIGIQTVEELWESVSMGQSDAAVSNIASASYYISQKGITNLKVAGVVEEHLNLGTGIRKEFPELVSILNKAVATITPEQRQAIETKWVSLRYEQGVDWKTVYKWLFLIFSLSGSIIVIIFIWNRKLLKEIEKRRQADELLKVTQELYRSLVENQTDIVSRFNSDGTFTFVNEAYCHFFQKTKDELVGKRWQPVVPVSDDLTFIEDKLRRLSPSNPTVTIENKICAGNGEIRWFQFVNSAFFDKDGNLRETQSVGRDITEIRQTENALQQSEERYRAIFNGMTEGFALHEIICDADGIPRDYRFMEINPAFERLTGLKRADVVDRLQSQLLPNEDPKWMEMYGRVALTGEPCQFENYSPVFKQYFQVFAYSPAYYQFAVLFMDITERRLAEDSLRDSEERLASVLEGSQLGYWDWDITNGKVERNERWAEMLGYTLTEIELSVKQWTDLHHPDDQQIASQSLNDHLEGRTEMHKAEYRMRTKDGQYKWILDCAKIVKRDAEGRPLRMSGTHTDITERKKIEEEIHKLNTELENRVLERTIQLESANTQLETANSQLESANSQLEATNKEMESFSYSVSHDLRAPLRSIDGWSLALAEDFEEIIGGQGKQYVERIRAETQRMGQLIDNLLKLSRITRSELFINKINISESAGKVVDKLKETYSESIKESYPENIKESYPESKVEFIIRPDLIAYADSGMMDIVLTNLIGNALKFTGKTVLPRIEFGKAEETEKGKQIFFVKDNGAGFDMKYSGKLFGAFSRLHKATEFSGTGIGLATVQRIIHRHGGRVWAEGEVNKGAIFYFTL